MGRMGYGYGSEFHLLRWMGRHRGEFDKRVGEVLGIGDAKIEWFDFDFDERKPIPDAEVKGLGFLKDDSRYGEIKADFEVGECSWPQRGESMNWDAVGRVGRRYILCEAKAHVEEIEKVHKLTPSSSVEQRRKAFEFAKGWIGVTGSPDWLRNYFQMANRLYILSLLDKHQIDAVLLNVYFCGDGHSNWTCPRSSDEWDPIIQDEARKLGIEDNLFVKANVKNLFLPVMLK